VLAGEIQKPGSFSYSALRIIAEIEPKIAQLFQEYAASRVAEDAILFHSTDGSKTIAGFLDLADAGLVIEPSGNLTKIFRFNAPGRFDLTIGCDRLSVLMADKNCTEISVACVNITRAGQQLCNLFTWESLASARELVSFLEQRITEAVFAFEGEPLVDTDVKQAKSIKLWPKG
ncbi:MAG: DUF2806 domain-containing protein, partial [Fimbriimonadaceae bacterium]|nr:DUF2806 domain-containing protein [Alphaproteobacteria bacterium]